MYVSKINSLYTRHHKARLAQGDILQTINMFIGLEESHSNDVELPYSVVMNQDCDLNSDHLKKEKGRQSIPSILLCPAYQADQFFNGQHIESWNIKPMNKGESEKVMNNDEMKRFHYLYGDSKNGVPELVIDFKHFYTIPRDLLYDKLDDLYIVTISELYREELSQRFANFLSRIGLPEAI